MSTRGLFGFRKNEKDKAVYNHFDSYPECLGKNFVKFIVKNAEKMDEYFDKIIEIDPRKKPTKEEIAICKEMNWYDGSVSQLNEKDWYCLLRGLQNLDEWQKAIDAEMPVFIENVIGFIKESLFCEYAYIYDIDRKTLEFYKGFQKTSDKTSRYQLTPKEEADKGHDYYPCRLAGVFTLKELENTKEIIAKIAGSD